MKTFKKILMEKLTGKKRKSRPEECVQIEPPAIIRPSNCSREFKPVNLKNGLTVLLVVDKTITHSAASMVVRAGSFLDPPLAHGLAHLVEHMLFEGSQKFPNGKELKDFLTKHGGEANACTEMEKTTYHMEVPSEFFEGALDRFAHLFIKPLMKTECIAREIDIIQSEFELHKAKDGCCLDQLLAYTSPESHPFNRFPWGNKNSLSAFSPESLRQQALELFDDYYLASSMHLVVVGQVSFDALETWVEEFFSDLKQGSSKSFPRFDPTTSIWKSDVCYLLESVCYNQKMRISWMIPPLSETSYLERPEIRLVQLLCQESKGSLSAFFKEKGWITKLDVWVGGQTLFSDDDDDATGSYENTSVGRLFIIQMDITNRGLIEKYQLVSFIYQYLKLVRDMKQHPKWFMRDHYKLLRMKFDCLEITATNPSLFANCLAGNMLKKCPMHHVVSLEYLHHLSKKEAFEELLTYFSPSKMRIDIILSSLPPAEVIKEVPWFNARYTEEEIAPSWNLAWSNTRDVHSSLQFPRRNEFMASAFIVKNYQRDSEDKEENCGLAEDKDEYCDLSEGEEDSEIAEDEDCEIVEDEEDSEVAEEEEEEDSEVIVEETVCELIVDEPCKRLYYKEEDGLSSAFFRVGMNVGDGPKERVRAEVFVDVLTYVLDPIVFKGSEAYINTELSLGDDEKLVVKFHGYKEKLSSFISAVWKQFTSFLPTKQEFEVIMETRLRSPHAKLLDLTEHATRLLSERIMKGGYAMNEKFNLLEALTYEDFCEFVPSLRSQICIEGICFGDLSKDEVLEISDALKPVGLSAITKVPRSYHEMTHGSTVRSNAKVINRKETNSLAKIYLQVGCERDQQYRMIALLHLFNDVVEEKLFNQLRDREKLGYEVASGLCLTGGVKGFYSYVVSAIHDPEFLLERIYNFIDSIGDILNGVDEATFNSHKEGVLCALRGDSGESIWLMFVETGDMDFRFSKVHEQLKRMTKQDVIGFYNEYFTKPERRCLEICIWGCKTSPPTSCE